MSEYRIYIKATGEEFIFDTLDECFEFVGVTEDNYDCFVVKELCRGNETEIDLSEYFKSSSRSKFKIVSKSTGETYVCDTLDECLKCCDVTSGNHKDYVVTELCSENETEVDLSVYFANCRPSTAFEEKVFQRHTQLTARVAALGKANASNMVFKAALHDVIEYEEFFKRYFDLDVQKFYK